MRKLLTGVLIVLLLSTMGTIGQAQQDGIIKVYGTVYLDGEPLEDAHIRVINEDTGIDFVTNTDSNGSYEVLIPAKNNDPVKVIASFEDLESQSRFIVQSSQKNYQIDFDFEVPPEIKIVKEVFGFIYALKPYTVVVYIILCLIATILLIKIGHLINHNGHKRD